MHHVMGKLFHGLVITFINGRIHRIPDLLLYLPIFLFHTTYELSSLAVVSDLRELYGLLTDSDGDKVGFRMMVPDAGKYLYMPIRRSFGFGEDAECQHRLRMTAG